MKEEIKIAFINTVDTFNEHNLGDPNYASVVIGSERDCWTLPYGSITEYNPAATNSGWTKISGLDSFDASEDTNLIECWDNRQLMEKKEGRTNSTITISQYNKGTLNSIYTLKGQDLWFAECISDDRDPVDTDGNAKYQEIRIMRGSLPSIKEEKGGAEDLYRIIAEGSYSVASKRIIQRGVTPTAVTISGATGLVSGSTQSMTITATDFSGDSIDLTDITADKLMGEISSISCESVSGESFTQSAGTASNIVKITSSSTTPGSIVLRAKIVTNLGGIWYSDNKTITYTTV